MSESHENLTEDTLVTDVLSSPKPRLPTSSALNFHRQIRTPLPPFTDESSNCWPPNLWLPRNTPNYLPAQAVSSASPYQRTSNSRTPSDHQRRNLQGAIDRYLTFIPRINGANVDNYGAILADVVKETEKEVLLDTFYRLLYTLQPSDPAPIIIALQNSLHQFSELEASLRGLALCRLIHDTFTNPIATASYFGVGNDFISAQKLNAHEFHRIFLAVKILLDCVREVDEPHKSRASLTKASIFNTYQICIYRLINSNYSNLDQAASPESLILGQASIGRLMRVVFRNVASKRLGKRGSSKYHFTGVAWRETALDNDVRHLIQLEPSQVKRHFESTIRKVNNIPVPKPGSIRQPPKISQSPVVSTPFLSYVKSSSRFPATDFLPWVKERFPRRVPAQPKWLREMMYRSIQALEQYNVNLRQPIEEYQAGDFAMGSQSSFYRVAVFAEREFAQNCEDDAYLHLHILLLSSFLPAVFASDEEVLPAMKILFRASMRNFAKELQVKYCGSSQFEKKHRRILMGNLKKLIHISETILVVLPRKLATTILQVMIDDLVELENKRSLSSGVTTLDNVCSKPVITMFNAFPQVFPNEKQYKVLMVNRTFQIFQKMCTELIVYLQSFLREAELGNPKYKVEALPFAIFRLYVDSCHKWILNRDMFSEIPIPVLRLFFTRLGREIQSMNFQAFGKRHPQIATETFKTSWLITSAFHEYFILISELIALSQYFD